MVTQSQKSSSDPVKKLNSYQPLPKQQFSRFGSQNPSYSAKNLKPATGVFRTQHKG
ncbi:MAG TPA: hypothetical protein VI819_01100 [Patescibacteria group bacterium]|nr:hypothetical protein [Patescibacteria group bacterium]